MKNQKSDLNRKQRKIKLLLGDLISELYKNDRIRFLYTSEGIHKEKEVKKLLALINYLNTRISQVAELPETTELPKAEELPESKEAESQDTMLGTETPTV